MKLWLWQVSLFAVVSLHAVGCGGNELEAPPAGEQEPLVSQLSGPCSASVVCDNGTTSSCTSSSAPDTCYTGTNFVSCDGVKTYCPANCTPPAVKTIVEYLEACYPAQSPYGRVGISDPEPGVSYKWSSVNTTLYGYNPNSIIQIKPWVIGWYNVTVTATRDGCTGSTVFSRDFYAPSCE